MDIMGEIRAMIRGEEAALERVIEAYLPLVKGVVTKVLAPAELWEQIPECVNDVFYSIWKNGTKFKGEGEDDFRRWICAVAKYRAIDVYRRERKEIERRFFPPAEREDGERETEEVLRPCAAGSAEEEAINREEMRALEERLNLLSLQDRKIFVMKFFLGMKTAEISRRMGLSPTAVDNRVSRGRKRLLRGNRWQPAEGSDKE